MFSQDPDPDLRIGEYIEVAMERRQVALIVLCVEGIDYLSRRGRRRFVCATRLQSRATNDCLVAIYSPNQVDFPIIVWATHRLGAAITYDFIAILTAASKHCPVPQTPAFRLKS